MTWQPIETAPKDGSAVLVHRNLFSEGCNGHNTYVAEWWADEGQGPEGSGRWVCYMDLVQDPDCPVEPTHWMPLPKPPARA